MNNYKPIETRYNGYRFRSRLEARWAVFFDEAHINYEYEPEGFELPELWLDETDYTYYHRKANRNCVLCRENIRYLPDFYLPDSKLYVEVKPNYDKLMEESLKLGAMINGGKTNPIKNGLLVLGQIPYYKERSGIIPFFPIYYQDPEFSKICIRWIYFELFEHERIKPSSFHDSSYSFDDYLPEVDDWHDFTGNNSTVFMREFKNKLYRTDLIGKEWEGSRREAIEFYSDMCRPYFLKANEARFEYGESP